MQIDTLRQLVQWNPAYRQEWDSSPEQYVDSGVVQWGKSRRLGALSLGQVKAYLGVQHIDPSKPGWRFIDAPQARFFLSLFYQGQVVTLRTFPDMAAAMQTLADFVERCAQVPG